MEILTKLLRALGFTGKSLDKAIAQMSKLDAYLEQVEALEQANIKKAEDAAAKAATAGATAKDNAERAARIRARAKEFIA